ncbi:molybdenum cofactor guanylyltransferase [Algoriphagus halophilus]|uniref:Probable molybdenum cofactor guanylyltransferase n=1 Tax=Algoriphagus halophilus TaxID=226505 RepID=A0A1N6G9M4_9BACT|nr:molybdenum cofactor guanylyltransferase [Algoriphagus halophilus]SIO04177.1 molybdenum cofactor guanylyltransferase [Algoriphagus halophilus]
MLRINEDIAVYILCGGKSSRMNTEKGLVKFQGKTFLQWILDAVTPLTSDITLVTKNAAYVSYGIPMISDLVEDQGPVGGIYTALADSSTRHNLLLSCDIPKITTEVLTFLIQSSISSDNDVCILSDGKHDYPLIGCYQKSLLPVFQYAIEHQHLKLCPLVDSLRNQKLVITPKYQAAIRNINTQKELLSLT